MLPFPFRLNSIFHFCFNLKFPQDPLTETPALGNIMFCQQLQSHFNSIDRLGLVKFV